MEIFGGGACVPDPKVTADHVTPTRLDACSFQGNINMHLILRRLGRDWKQHCLIQANQAQKRVAGVAVFCFLLAAAAGFTGGKACAQNAPPNAPYIDQGPMVGHVEPNSARIWVRATGEAPLALRIGKQADLGDGRTVAGPRLQAGADFAGHVAVADLEPSTRYYYAPLLDGQPSVTRPYPSFVTAPPASAPLKMRFAFGSCVGRRAADPAAAWGDMAARAQFDLLLMLGDNNYADSTDPVVQRAFYREQRSVAGFREVTRRTPTYGIWDDHDYGPNDSDGTAPGKERSLQTFQQLWANPSYGQADDPGIYSKFSRGDVEFFLLDDRYHRSPNKAPDDGTKTMLGVKQLAWLKRELLASKAKIKFVASGSEWQINGHADSWTSFDRERRDIWKFIADNKIQGVMLLSGDRHFTGGYQINGQLIEITSGPLGATNYPSIPLPEMFLNYGEGKLYCIFDVDTRTPQPTVALEVYRAGAGLIETRRFTWDEINGVTKIPALPMTTASVTQPAVAK